MTDASPSSGSPARIELPEEIAFAIDELSSAEGQEARAMAFASEAEFAKLVEKSEAAYDALTAAILSRLREADRKTAWLEWMLNRIAFDTDGSARESDDGHDWPALAREALEVRDPVLMPAMTAERDAALARVERLEKALEAMLTNYGPPGALLWSLEYPADHPISVARSALSMQSASKSSRKEDL